MSREDALEKAYRMGLTAWIEPLPAVVGAGGRAQSWKCVGFASAELPMGAGLTWEEAFDHAQRVIYAA